MVAVATAAPGTALRGARSLAPMRRIQRQRADRRSRHRHLRTAPRHRRHGGPPPALGPFLVFACLGVEAVHGARHHAAGAAGPAYPRRCPAAARAGAFVLSGHHHPASPAPHGGHSRPRRTRHGALEPGLYPADEGSARDVREAAAALLFRTGRGIRVQQHGLYPARRDHRPPLGRLLPTVHGRADFCPARHEGQRGLQPPVQGMPAELPGVRLRRKEDGFSIRCDLNFLDGVFGDGGIYSSARDLVRSTARCAKAR